MSTEAVSFTNPSGESLAGRLDLPDGPARAFALFAHCFTCGKNIKAAARVAAGLAREGVAVLRFDFTGLGSSAGEFADTTFSSNVDDLVAAAEFLRREHTAPALLIGHSLGGTAVLRAAAKIPSAAAIATIGAPADPMHVRRLLADAEPEIAARGLATVILAGRKFTIKQAFLDDLEAHDMSETLAGLHRPLVVMHAPLDELVAIDNARQLYEAAKHPKSFVSLDGADHLLTRDRDAKFVAGVLAAWAGRYIDEAPDRPAGPPGPQQVSVHGPRQGFRTDVWARQHHVVADEPTTVAGGTDTGATPYDLVLAGLGACTAMTLRMYASHKGWPLQRARVILDHDKVHAKDCQECPQDGAAKIDRITRKIWLEGDLTAQQRARLLEIADRCPVHRTLTGTVVITSELKG
ncbi:MAG: bifunctional alpha/beta hydrolase/OsmC family protein [Nannocystaceae bacterium]